MVAVILALMLAAPPPAFSEWPPRVDPVLGRQVRRILRAARRRFGLREVAATVVDLNRGRRASVRGGRSFYAASVIKVPFAIALYQGVRAGRVSMTPSLRRDLARMLGPSSNAAANRILDLACDTRPGAALRGAPLRRFVRRRACVNRVLRRLGLTRIRASHKLSLASGRERQLYRFHPSNSITTDDVARLLLLLHRGEAADPRADHRILMMMKRRAGIGHPVDAPFARGVPRDLQVFSKAGWTRAWAHDAALLVGPPPRRQRVLLVVASRQARPTQHLPWIARRVWRLFSAGLVAPRAR